MAESLITVMESLEERFIKENFDYSTSFIIKKGKIPVMVSAPHSVDHFRNGYIKTGEYRSGSLTEVLHQKTSCFSAYKTKNFGDDPNFDDHNAYKDELIKTVIENNIKYLLDLHIMAPSREHLIDIGTGHGENIKNDIKLVKNIVGIFNKNNINQVEIDKKFSASNQNTVSSTIARECKIICLQLEMNWRILDTSEGNNNLMNVLKSLEDTVQMLVQI